MNLRIECRPQSTAVIVALSLSPFYFLSHKQLLNMGIPDDVKNGGKPRSRGEGFDEVIPGHGAMKTYADHKAVSMGLVMPHVARANIAATPEHPDGTLKDDWAARHKHQTVMQQHVAFWDQDGDGIIWPTDTFRGMWQMGYNTVWCLIGTLIINCGFSYFASSSWIPDPLFRIEVAKIHGAKHGSTTLTFDNEGRFVPIRFEEIFSKYDRENKGGITFRDGLRMLRGNRNLWDFVGWLAAFVEFVLTYLLIWPEDGIMRREDIRRVYDGSIFFDVAEKEKTRSHRPFSGWHKHNQIGKDI
jgi:hypothetical protein